MRLRAKRQLYEILRGISTIFLNLSQAFQMPDQHIGNIVAG